jgi:hypothetical protein
MGRKRRGLDYSLIDEFLKKKPTGCWKEFRQTYPDAKLSDASFYTRKRKLLGPIERQKHGPRIYTAICNVDQSTIEEAVQQGKTGIVNLVKTLIADINAATKLRLQVIQLTDPATWEIRRLTK